MLEVRRLKDCHSHSHAKAVVSSESSSLCLYPLSVNPCLDRILLEIMDCIVVLLRNHIDMSLKDHTLAVFITRSGRLADHDVADLVLDGLKAMRLSPVVHILDSKLLML